MGFWKSCKFYQDSRCSLKGHYCDLNCNQMRDEGAYFSDQSDSPSQWRRKGEGVKISENGSNEEIGFF